MQVTVFDKPFTCTFESHLSVNPYLWTFLSRLYVQLPCKLQAENLFCQAREVDRNARVKSAEQRAERAEQQTRTDAITIRELTRRAEAAEQQAMEQEQFMRGFGIWQRFMQRIEERQRQEPVHHRTR